MILVDSSVWIDYFRGGDQAQTRALDALLGTEVLVIGDLILAEVLQGFSDERAFRQARKALAAFEVVTLGGEAIALRAVANFRALRALGISVRKTIDTLIATWCIENRCLLLHADRDFDPFARHLGLKVV